MNWTLSHRADKRALPLADRHYNRQKIGSPQFVPPGRCTVLLTRDCGALWVSSWPFAEYVRHAWAGAWICSCFRRESGERASTLITEAVAVTRIYWEVPPLGMVTFIDRDEVQPTMVRGEPIYGWTYIKAGWRLAECPKHEPTKNGVSYIACKACRHETAGGLLALQLTPERMPCAQEPYMTQRQLAI